MPIPEPRCTIDSSCVTALDHLGRLPQLDYHGTLWILGSFHKLGLMSSSDLRTAFLVLHAQGIRLPWKLVNELLARVGEEPLEL